MTAQVLYISGSVGLGHVTRDLAIADALRGELPDARIQWLAAEPARTVVREAGESLHPLAPRWSGDTGFVGDLVRSYRINLLNPVRVAGLRATIRATRQGLRSVRANVAAFKEATRNERFDVVVADEAYEIALLLLRRPGLKPAPFAWIVDFVGSVAMSGSWTERLLAHVLNRVDVRRGPRALEVFDRTLLIGELEDLPERPLGPGLPTYRELARSRCLPVGYVVRFDPAEMADRSAARAVWAPSGQPLVVCAVGGTGAGRDLLELCGRSYETARSRIPELRMVLVCGPAIKPASIAAPAGVQVLGYVPRLHELLAASDLAIVQGGGTTTFELTALRRPFLYFPLEEHFEQQVHVAGRVERHGAGVRMSFAQTTPDGLAEAIAATIGREAWWPPVPTDGAVRAARSIAGLVGNQLGGGGQ